MNIKFTICFFSFLFIIIGNVRGQVTIGAGIEPDPSAMLDLQSNGKLGFLLPRVVLTDTLSFSPLAAHVKGMSVYNTTASADGKVKEGIYWNDGRRWWRLATLDPAMQDAWYTTGNAGTDPAVNFLGTTDDKPMAFRVNNTRSGYISNIDGLPNYTSFGYKALSGGNTGEANNAFGYNALLNNTTGVANSAFGTNALAGNIVGGNNTAVGNRALANNNSTIGSNTGVGGNALQANTDGFGNTALGFSAMQLGTTGNDNTGIGTRALINTAGSGNTALGNNAMQSNVSGNNNTAIGTHSLSLLGDKNAPAGENNTAVGKGAGSLSTRGNNNILLGVDTQVSDTVGSHQMNIGYAIFGTGMDGATRNPMVPAGNIGIRTAGPQRPFHVNSRVGTTETPVRFEGLPKTPAALTPSRFQRLAIDTVTGDIYRRDNDAWLTTGNSGTTLTNNYIGTADSTGLSIRTNKTERVQVTADGRVGIGAVPATQRYLQVNAKSNPVRIQSLPKAMTTIATNPLVMDTNGDVYVSQAASPGQILRITLKSVQYNTTERAIRLDSVQTKAPSTASNNINTIAGATISYDKTVAAGNGAPARTTDPISLPPGVYQITVRVVGSFSAASSSNNFFIKAIVNGNEYSLANQSSSGTNLVTFYYIDFINIEGSTPQTVDFTGQTLSPSNAYTTQSSVSPSTTITSMILIQRLR